MKTLFVFLVSFAFFGLSPSKCERRIRRQMWPQPPNPDPFWMGHSPEFHKNDDYFNSPEDTWMGSFGFNRPLGNQNSFQNSRDDFEFNGGNTQNQWDDFPSNEGNNQNSRGGNRRNGNNKNRNKQKNQNRKNGNNRRNQNQNGSQNQWGQSLNDNGSQNNQWDQSQNSQNNRWDQNQNSNQNNRRDQNQNNRRDQNQNNRRDQNQNGNESQNNRRNQNQGTTEPTGPLSTTPTTIHVAPEGCPCPMTQQYNPVCGTDGNTYRNEGLLNCYQRCGKGVSQKRLGVC